MLRTLVSAAVLACALLPRAQADDAPKGDLAKVQGKWKAKVGPDQDIPITVEIKGTVVTVLVTLQDRELTLKGEIKLDESKSPKQWDWTKFRNLQGEPAEENLAIYKLDGDDKLTLCSGGPGNPRPSKFEAGEDGPPNLVEFARVKEEPKK